MKALLSNSLDELFDAFKDDILADSSGFFDRRIVLVPHKAMRSWVQQSLASDPHVGVCMGLEILSEVAGIGKLASMLSSMPLPHVPTRLELSLLLFSNLEQILRSFGSLAVFEQQLWKPVIDIVWEKRDPCSTIGRREQRRLIHLSDTLSGLFEHYGNVGGQVTAQWREKLPDHWQAHLWASLFFGEKAWCSREELLRCALPEQRVPIRVYVFGFGYLSPLHTRFIDNIARSVEVKGYIQSPCSYFWSDLHSNREATRVIHRLEKGGVNAVQVADLEELLQDTNSLLANMGLQGRDYARRLEGGEVQMESAHIVDVAVQQHPSYVSSFDTNIRLVKSEDTLTLLHALQADLVLLRNPEQDPAVELDTGDSSVQIHECVSKTREVEAIYDAILGLMDHYGDSDAPLLPSEVSILAPNIEEYDAALTAVFGSPASLLPYRIEGVSLAAHSSFVEVFLSILEMASGRWDAASVLQLFESSFFQKRHQLTPDEVAEIRSWIQKSSIYWGESVAHRNAVLERAHCDKGMVGSNPAGTWEHGLSRLLMGLATHSLSAETACKIGAPVSGIEFSDADLLGKVSKLVTALSEDLRPLVENCYLTIDDWAQYLRCLCDSYLDVDDSSSDARRDREILYEEIARIGEAVAQVGSCTYSFDVINFHLKRRLESTGTGAHVNELQTVRCCAMSACIPIPSRVIVVLGLTDGRFPANEAANTLDLMQDEHEADVVPTRAQKDRNSFLATILAARSHLLLSYVGMSERDGKQQNASTVLCEFRDYLNSHYIIAGEQAGKAITREHPFYAFDRKYFDDSTKLTTYSDRHYAAAKAYYCSDTRKPHSFVPEWAAAAYLDLVPRVGEEAQLTVPLTQLSALVKEPFKLYCNQTLGLYLHGDEEHAVASNEPLVVSPLERHRLRDEALHEPLEEVLNRAEGQGALPHGELGCVARNILAEDFSIMQHAMTSAGVEASQIFDVEFAEHCSAPKQMDERTWLCPPIKVNVLGVEVTLLGRIYNVSPKGLLTHGLGNSVDRVRAWPKLLLLHMAKLPGVTPQLLALKNSKIWQPEFDEDSTGLVRLLELYFLCLTHPCPVADEWTENFTKLPSDAIRTKMQQSLASAPYPSHPYLRWAFGATLESLPSLPVLEAWAKPIKYAYAPLFGGVHA